MKYAFVVFRACLSLMLGHLSVVAASEQQSQTESTVVSLTRSACRCGCSVAETSNYRIYWCAAESELRGLASACEDLRSRIASVWLTEDETQAWTPRCEVVVHAEVGSYARYLGRGSEQTSGCATITLDSGRVVFRRLDLRADALDWRTESLPHELTHVVLADHFGRYRTPPWLDEGVAMLAESPAKLTRRRQALENVMRGGGVPSIRRIVSMQERDAAVDPSAFYGQSVAVVAYLLERGTPRQLFEFANLSRTIGHEQALRMTYGIAAWSDVERGWRDMAASAQFKRYARHALPDRETAARLVSDRAP